MPKRIMIIDDEPDVSLYLQSLLEDAGYEVRIPDASLQVVDALIEMKPDLICLDIMMPRQSGFSLFKQLRLHPDLRQTPIIVLSGLTPPPDFASSEVARLFGGARIAPPQAVIEKPPRMEQFLETVKTIFEKKVP
jgi:CheY-like chemotaxis protein